MLENNKIMNITLKNVKWFSSSDIKISKRIIEKCHLFFKKIITFAIN